MLADVAWQFITTLAATGAVACAGTLLAIVGDAVFGRRTGPGSGPFGETAAVRHADTGPCVPDPPAAAPPPPRAAGLTAAHR